ncbi:MAG: hypothetical protein ABIJ56_06820, partial [Pseudomonadota bacterium]
VKGKTWGSYAYRPQVFFFPQQKTWAVLGQIHDTAQEYIVNGKTWGPFLSLECDFSFHNNLWGFAFEDKQGMRWVVMQGKKLGPFSRLELGPVANSTRKTWQTFLAEDAKDSKTYVFEKGKKKGPFPDAVDGTFKVQGSSWGFLGIREGKDVVVINGKEWGPFDQAMAPALYQGAVPWAFVAKSGGEWFVMKGGEKVPIPFKPQELMKVAVPAMVSNGLNWGTMKVSKEGWDVVTGSGTWGPFEKGLKEPEEFQVQPWGWSFRSWLGPQESLIVNGKKWTFKHGCKQIATSPDGKIGAFWGADQTPGLKDYSEDWYAVVDGKKYGPYGQDGHVTFDPSGAHWSFTAANNPPGGTQRYVVVDGKEFGPYGSIHDLRFSEDGSSWAAIEETPGKDCSAAPECDGKHFSVMQGGNAGCQNYSVIMDGQGQGVLSCYQASFGFRNLPKNAWWSLGLERGGKQYAAVNGTVIGPYDSVTPITIKGSKPPVLFAVKRVGKGPLKVVKLTLSSK